MQHDLYVTTLREPEQLDRIADLVRSFSESQGRSPENAIPFLVDAVVDPRGNVWVGLQDGEPAAYAMAFLMDDPMTTTCHVVDGYSKVPKLFPLVVEQIEAWARSKGVYRMRAVTFEHPEAMARAYGAKIVGYVLEKDLRS